MTKNKNSISNDFFKWKVARILFCLHNIVVPYSRAVYYADTVNEFALNTYDFNTLFYASVYYYYYNQLRGETITRNFEFNEWNKQKFVESTFKLQMLSKISTLTCLCSTMYFSDTSVTLSPSRSQENRTAGAPTARQRSFADVPALLAVFDLLSVVRISGLSILTRITHKYTHVYIYIYICFKYVYKNTTI